MNIVIKQLPTLLLPSQIIKQTDWGGTGICGLLIGPYHGDPVVSSVWRTDKIDSSDLSLIIEDCLAAFPCGKLQRIMLILMCEKDIVNSQLSLIAFIFCSCK